MTISLKQCIVYRGFAYEQAQAMDRNRPGFKTAILQQNFRKAAILGQISNNLTNQPFLYINREQNQSVTIEICAWGEKLPGVHCLTAQLRKLGSAKNLVISFVDIR